MSQTKHFNKTLQEISDILEELNEQLCSCLPEKEQAWWSGLSCEFNEWWACIKFQDTELFSTEADEREYIEEIDDYEDLKDCIKRVLLERFAQYSMYTFNDSTTTN